MTTTIPRVELNAIAAHYNVDYDLDSDPPVEWVRKTTAWLRRDLVPGEECADRLLAEADELDALADRCEREAAA